MIIELTGIPGAGKSTFIKELEKTGNASNTVTQIEKFIRKKALFVFPGVIGFDSYLVGNLFTLKAKDIGVLKSAFRIVMKSQNNGFSKANILRNIYKKLVIYRILSKYDHTFIVDEGISHIPMSLFVDIDSKINENQVKLFCKKLPSIDSLIVLDATDSELLGRVINRGTEGHRRMDFTNPNKIKSFMNASRNIIEIIKEEFSPKVIFNTESNASIEDIMDIIELKNV